MNDQKFEYFIERTERDFDELKEALEALNARMDQLNEWKIKIETRNALVASMFGGLGSVVVLVVGYLLKVN